MAHILRKYTSNRGSALFMVISTMTALIISCMAMYFTMVSANSAQYAVFGQMQATQTAESVLDIVRNSLNPYNKLNPEFQAKMLALEPGQSITTDANGFMALDPNIESGKTPAEIGAYSVTITCIEKEGEVGKDLKMKFDYLVMSSFNGSRDAIHFIQSYDESYEGDPNAGADGSGGDAELFAATGYVPNDAYISGGYYLTDVFYDTQYTYMNTYGGSGENRIGQNLATGGDLMLGTDAMTVVHSASGEAIASDDVAQIGPITWAIRGNFYPTVGNDFGMRGGSRVLVGGDFTPTNDSLFAVKNDGYTGSIDLTDVAHKQLYIYVNGDFTYTSGVFKPNTWIFVNGNVYANANANGGSNARLFVTGTPEERAKKTENLHSNITVEEWSKDSWPSGMWPTEQWKDKNGNEQEPPLTYNQAMKLLGMKTQTIAYYKWDLNKETKDAEQIDIKLNASNSPWEGLDAYQSTYIISYDKNTITAPLIESGSENGVFGKSFIINSIATNTDYNSCGQTIIIDTGDDPTNIINIKLSDVTGNEEFAWFGNVVPEHMEWWPEEKLVPEEFQIQTGSINNNMRHVFVVGRGTVLINVPNGITYTDAGFQHTGHIGWWLIKGGEITENNGHINFNGPDPRGKYSATVVPYIHKTCAPGDGCEFSFSEIETACIGCGGKLTQVSCDVHNDVNKFCATCYPEKKDRDDWCKNHVDNLKFEDFYDTLDSDEKEWVTGKDGDIVYPTTNFMLVSCDESAEMRFATTKDGNDISYNSFFGFIYAPYMTYLNAGSAAGAITIKLCGGMTVGDYDLKAVDTFLGCYPDHMPNELAGMAGGGSMAGGKLSGVTKNWKITIGGYT